MMLQFVSTRSIVIAIFSLSPFSKWDKKMKHSKSIINNNDPPTRPEKTRSSIIEKHGNFNYDVGFSFQLNFFNGSKDLTSRR